jgi:hypothetical protein
MKSLVVALLVTALVTSGCVLSGCGTTSTSNLGHNADAGADGRTNDAGTMQGAGSDAASTQDGSSGVHDASAGGSDAIASDAKMSDAASGAQDAAATEGGDGGPAGCTIQGITYPAGASNPANPCQTCEPSFTAQAWTAEAAGTACGAVNVCSASGCTIGCFIDGQVRATGTANPNNGCQSCEPAASTTKWTAALDGTTCGHGQVCMAGECGSGCEIAGKSVASGAINPANACSSCQPGVSTSSWTGLSDGTSCGTGQVCASAVCAKGCVIGGTLYASGGIDPADACETCQPSTSTSSWTALSDGTSCGTGQVCAGAVCANRCFIGGTLYPSGAVDPANACKTCQPSTSTSSWTALSDGTGCTGGACIAGVCQAAEAGGPADAGGPEAGDAASDSSSTSPPDAASDAASDSSSVPDSSCITDRPLSTSGWVISSNLQIVLATTTEYSCRWLVNNHLYDYVTCDGWIWDTFITSGQEWAVVGWNLATNAMYTQQVSGHAYNSTIATDCAQWAVQTIFPGGNLANLTIE